MAQLNNKNEVSRVENHDDKKIVIEVDQKIPEQIIPMVANQLQQSVQEAMEVIHLKLEQNSDEVKRVQQTIENNTITPQQLEALNSAIHKKANEYVRNKKIIQLTLNFDDPDSLVSQQKLLKKEVGRIKSKIIVELNKDCLDRKGNEPKNKIRKEDFNLAFDFVKGWIKPKEEK